MNTQSMCSSGLLRTVLMAGLLFLAIGYTSIADAAQGCGFGLHRNYWGRCVLNSPGTGATPAPFHPGCWRNPNGNLRCYRY